MCTSSFNLLTYSGYAPFGGSTAINSHVDYRINPPSDQTQSGADVPVSLWFDRDGNPQTLDTTNDLLVRTYGNSSVAHEDRFTPDAPLADGNYTFWTVVGESDPKVAVITVDTIAPTFSLLDTKIAVGGSLRVLASEDGSLFVVVAGTPVTDAASLNSLSSAQLVVNNWSVSMGVIASASPIEPLAAGDYEVYVRDWAGNLTGPQSFSVTDSAMSLTAPSGTLPFLEKGPDIAVGSELKFSLPDTDFHSATVSLIGPAGTIGVAPGEGLQFTADADTMGDIGGTYAGGVLSLHSVNGANAAQWQAAFAAVTYRNTSSAPLQNGIVRFELDVAGQATIAKATVVVAIEQVNDAPSIVGVPGHVSAITVGSAFSLAGITVADPDSNAITLTVTTVNGTVSGLADGNAGIPGIQLAGTVAQINAALAQATFNAAATGTASISLLIDDMIAPRGDPSVYTFIASAPTTPVVTPPTTPITIIDGVPVQIGTGISGYQQITVPVITGNGVDNGTFARSKLADIPLVKDAAGKGLLTVGTPIGAGFTATGPGAPVSSSDAQPLLTNIISALNGSAQQQGAAQSFIGWLAGNIPIIVQSLTPVMQTSGNGPLAVSVGTPQDNQKSVLVIDTSGLPAAGSIKLDNIDFAAIIGAARVVGGAGANIAYGDGASQFVVLGADDDVLHGGGGNDTVGSLRGDDQAFGDDGDDVVYGGTGNDVLHGGNGNDRMNGGFGLDRAVQTGVLADYAVTVDGHTVVLTHNTSGAVDRFTDVEVIAFDSGTSLIVAHEAADVASLQAQFAGAQLIELNATRAVTGSASNDDITPAFGMALNIDLGAGNDIVRIAGARADVHIDVEAGQRAELTRLADGAMLALNNVELLSFANGDVTVLAHNRAEAVIGRAYELLLDRNVDTGGYAFWVGGITNGASLAGTLNAIMQSPEFTGASASNSAFLDLLYTAGFDRAADAAGKAFWLAALDSGVSRAQVVESFAMSNEAISVIGSTIDVTVVA